VIIVAIILVARRLKTIEEFRDSNGSPAVSRPAMRGCEDPFHLVATFIALPCPSAPAAFEKALCSVRKS
jgi:hypothetical protein